MNFTYCNVTADDGDVSAEVPLAIGLKFHDLGLLLCIGFGGLAVVLSLFLMFMHATHYSEPLEQRYILRILFMVPIYSVVSFLSFAYYKHNVYFEVLRDCYEAFAIASFFALMCHYVAPDLHQQKEKFRSLRPKRWVWPASWGRFELFKTPRSGLTWFNIIWFCVFQYCVVRVACTILAVVTEAFGRYCISSESPLFAHVWVSVIEAVAVSVAMFCLIQFYIQLKEDLAPYKPGMKLVAIKAVIFLSFWQTFLLSILTSPSLPKPIVQAGEHVAQPDLIVGIPALCICIEMALFSIMHVFVYPWRPYDINSSVGMQIENQTGAKRDRYYGGFLGIKALLDAYNPIDILRAIGRGFRWMFVGRKSRFADKSYHTQGIGADGATLDNAGNLGSLGGLTAGKQGKYSKLDDGEDSDDIPLTSQAAMMTRSHSDIVKEPRYPQNPFDDRPEDSISHSGGIPSPFADTEFGVTSPTRPFSPYEAYRAQRRSKHHVQQSMGDLGTASPPPLSPSLRHGHSNSDGLFQPTPLHTGSIPMPGAGSGYPDQGSQRTQENSWAYGKPI